MKKYYFSAYGLTNELDLNAIAQHFGITKKYKWEEPLVLDNNHLSDICGSSEERWVHVYFFGSVVFINFSAAQMASFIKYLENNFNNSKANFALNYIDEYELEFNPDAELKVSNDDTTAPNEDDGYIDIISLILARSVALDRIENSINKLVDEVEDIITLLEKGKLNIKDEQLAKLASKILRFKYASISYIMLFDKPDITWHDIDIDEFYYEMVELFELEDRYEQVKHKLETLMDVTEVFSSLTHEKRATRLEWMIIILIVIEIILYVVEMFNR